MRALYYQPRVQKQFCSATYAVNVYLEHAQERLSGYRDIPLRDSLYCILAMLNGYKKLYEQVDGFEITEDQVIIDSQGEVRVWLNSDL